MFTMAKNLTYSSLMPSISIVIHTVVADIETVTCNHRLSTTMQPLYGASLQGGKDTLFNQYVQLVTNFISEFKRPPRLHEQYGGVEVGKWCDDQRRSRDYLWKSRWKKLDAVPRWTWTRASRKVSTLLNFCICFG